MIVATFGTSSPHAGKQVAYDSGRFLVDGLPLTFQQVFEFDARGELDWSYNGLQEWMTELIRHQNAAAASSIALPETPGETATTMVAQEPVPAYPEASRPGSPATCGDSRQLAQLSQAIPKDKSVGAALVLTFLFGPIGLFYCVAWWAALLMFVGAVLVAVPTLGIGDAVIWVASMIWAAVAAGKQHSAFLTWLARQQPAFITLPPHS